MRSNAELGGFGFSGRTIELELALYLQNMTQGISAWDLATAQGVDEAAIERQRAQRDLYYQEYLQNEDIEIPGVEQALRGLSTHYRMAIITTAKRVDFELLNQLYVLSNIRRHIEMIRRHAPKDPPCRDKAFSQHIN
jgi:hypothetical protein